jgi:hypothetical protein
VHYGNRSHLSTNNCTIEVNYHLMLPYICFGHYMTIIRGMYKYMHTLHCALSTFNFMAVLSLFFALTHDDLNRQPTSFPTEVQCTQKFPVQKTTLEVLPNLYSNFLQLQEHGGCTNLATAVTQTPPEVGSCIGGPTKTTGIAYILPLSF